jgi:hypothetical protein
MKSKGIVMSVFALMASAAAGSLQAAEIKATATITYVVTSSAQSKLGDRGTMIRLHQKGVIITTDPASPFNLNAQDCDGMVIVAPDGKTEGSGSCDAADKDGDRWSIWWVDSGNGGTWGVTHGTGKFAGMTGGGTDTYSLQLDDRAVITIDGTLNIKSSA